MKEAIEYIGAFWKVLMSVVNAAHTILSPLVQAGAKFRLFTVLFVVPAALSLSWNTIKFVFMPGWLGEIVISVIVIGVALYLFKDDILNLATKNGLVARLTNALSWLKKRLVAGNNTAPTTPPTTPPVKDSQ